MTAGSCAPHPGAATDPAGSPLSVRYGEDRSGSVLLGLDDTITVAGETGTIAFFAREGRIQLHHIPDHVASPGGAPRPAWWVDVFSRDTIDAERYQISEEDYDALLASTSNAEPELD
jgi:hypothetical protein